MPKKNEINTLENIPPNMPKRNSFIARKVGYFILKLWGWKTLGPLPDYPKLIVIGAPHTSIWDFFVAVPVILAFNIKATIMMKKEAFFWPMKGLWRHLGFIPIDRHSPNGVVGSIVSHVEKNRNIWVVLTPEGTRSKAAKWRTGFLSIANKSNIPILIIWGSKDTVTPISNAFFLEEKLDNIELIIYDDVGHEPQVEAQKMIYEDIINFLEINSQSGS